MSSLRELSFCTVPNYMLRAVRPEMVHGFAEGHNAGLWTCLCHILNVVVDGDRQDVATMPLSLGRLGLRDAVRTSHPAFWTSLADCIAMARARHLDVAALVLRAMRGPTVPPTLVSVQAVAHQLVGVEGFGHFGSRHFGSSLVPVFCLNHLMGRKGWSSVPIPDGWVQIIRVPRPKSQRSGPVRSKRAALFQQSKVVVEGGGGVLPVSTQGSSGGVGRRRNKCAGR